MNHVGLLKGSGKPYFVNVKIVLMLCTFYLQLFIVGDSNFYSLLCREQLDPVVEKT